MNITLSGTKVSMDGHTLAFQKNNLVDSMVITVDTDETWQYKLDVKYPCKDSNGKELYNVIDLTRVGNTCTAILQVSMLPFNGKYTMQLRGISDDKVYHTDTFDVWVKYSIDPGKVYDPVPSEFYQIEQAVTEEAANAKQAATESAESARQSAESSTNAQKSAENAAYSANEAQKSREAIENMEVAAVSLPPDSDATVEKSIVDDKVKLTFGIPKGEKGEGGTDISLGLTAATVGQTIKVKAVDTDGKPTSWEPVDMPTGGGGETWEKIAEIELRADTAEYVLADFATWRKAKVMMTRPKYISELNKNVWCRVVGSGVDDIYPCGYMTIGYGYIFWEFSAEVNEMFILSSHIETNNRSAGANVTSTGTFTPLKSPVEKCKFKLIFSDTSIIQAGDKVTVIGVRR